MAERLGILRQGCDDARVAKALLSYEGSFISTDRLARMEGLFEQVLDLVRNMDASNWSDYRDRAMRVLQEKGQGVRLKMAFENLASRLADTFKNELRGKGRLSQ